MALLLIFGAGCGGPRRAALKDPSAPPAGYQRKIVVVLERAGFRPAPGEQIKVAVEAPTRLVSPSGGVGRTDARGALELVFEPAPHYDDQALKGGDIIADFPIKAYLSIGGPGRSPLIRLIEDRETYARYADPLYQGLNRDPETEATYYIIPL